jgi:hypothetical protein
VLSAFRSDQRFEPLVILFKRVANILAKATEKLPDALDAARLTEPARRSCWQRSNRRGGDRAAVAEACVRRRSCRCCSEWSNAIHSFFDRVLVNAGGSGVRANRLRLLATAAVFCGGGSVEGRSSPAKALGLSDGDLHECETTSLDTAPVSRCYILRQSRRWDALLEIARECDLRFSR